MVECLIVFKYKIVWDDNDFRNMYKFNSVYFDLIICSISINTHRHWNEN